MVRKIFIPFGKTADNSIDYLLGIIEDASVTTLQRVTGISKEVLHWQYAEGWNTIGVLLSHIICTRHVFRIMYIDKRELTKEEDAKYMPGLEMGKYIPKLITNDDIEVYLEKLSVSNIELVEAVSKLSKEQFFEKNEEDANLAWLLYHLAEDEVNHRGQISLLLKLYKVNVDT